MVEIELRDIRKALGAGAAEALAVQGVSLRIAPGEFFFLLGPSGCGKTTLLRMIAGLIDPTAGRILIGGRDVTDVPVEKRNTAMVFQNYALWPHMTVQQNVEFGLKMKALPRGQRKDIAHLNLQRVQMEEYAARKPNQLSGGQQQRVALARALAAQGQCLLLDEPLSNLDARLRLHMRGQLRELVKSSGRTAVYVTHDQKEALSMADRVAVMDRGRIVQVGSPEDVYNRPATRFVADFLGEANFIDGQLRGQALIDTPAGELAVVAGNVPPGTSAGKTVTCCVRPEQIRLAPAGSSAGGLSATVESTTYLGEIRQFLCRLRDGSRWKVSSLAGQAAGIDAGQSVILCIEPKEVIVLAE